MRVANWSPRSVDLQLQHKPCHADAMSVLDAQGVSMECAAMPESLRGSSRRNLAQLQEVAIGIAEKATDLVAVVDRWREEDGTAL